MRIALDLTPAVKPKPTGVGWYATHLARALAAELHDGDELLLCTRLSRGKARRHRPLVEGGRVRMRWFQEPFGPRGAPDVFHGPDARLPRAGAPALVATVHDVFSLESSGWASARFRERRRAHYEDLSERATRIAFSSVATRDLFLERYPAVKERSRVVHLGVDAAFRPVSDGALRSVRRRHALPDAYLLYVGEVSTRKNLPGMARGLAASGVALPWVWIGSDSHGAGRVHEEVAAVPGVRILRPGYVPFEDLPALYAGATALLFATWSEGFGLPALEAMACGTPAVVSDRSSLPEVTAGCALEADPHDADAIGAAIRRLTEDGALRASLAERGRARAALFGWDRVAREMYALYAEAASAHTSRS